MVMVNVDGSSLPADLKSRAVGLFCLVGHFFLWCCMALGTHERRNPQFIELSEPAAVVPLAGKVRTRLPWFHVQVCSERAQRRAGDVVCSTSVERSSAADVTAGGASACQRPGVHTGRLYHGYYGQEKA